VRVDDVHPHRVVVHLQFWNLVGLLLVLIVVDSVMEDFSLIELIVHVYFQFVVVLELVVADVAPLDGLDDVLEVGRKQGPLLQVGDHLGLGQHHDVVVGEEPVLLLIPEEVEVVLVGFQQAVLLLVQTGLADAEHCGNTRTRVLSQNFVELF